MNFINNWIARLTERMTPSDEVLPVSHDKLSRLEPGIYRLTLTSSSDPFEAVTEIIDYDAAAGLIIGRGLEGTQAQSWPHGSTIYASITAAMMAELANSGTDPELAQRLEALELKVQQLEQQIDECCQGGSSGGLTDQNGNTLIDQNGNILEA